MLFGNSLLCHFPSRTGIGLVPNWKSEQREICLFDEKGIKLFFKIKLTASRLSNFEDGVLYQELDGLFRVRTWKNEDFK